jgi:hypothetical protein
VAACQEVPIQCQPRKVQYNISRSEISKPELGVTHPDDFAILTKNVLSGLRVCVMRTL